jgi:hypothetical protein
MILFLWRDYKSPQHNLSFLYVYPIVAAPSFLHDEINMQLITRGYRTNRGLPDRRGSSRFPVHEDLKYTLLHSKTRKACGVGKTLNFGSRGILFTTEQQLPVGRSVEIAVNWPARLGGTCALQFVATGKIVRAEGQLAAVQIERYEFKTRREAASAGAGA